MNDDERLDWVLNDEGLYLLFRRSGVSHPRKWIRQHRTLIDEVTGNVKSGRRPAHYLAIPTQEESCPQTT